MIKENYSLKQGKPFLIKAVNELANGDKNKLERLLASSCRKVNCIAQESLESSERVYYESLMKKYPSTYIEDSLLADYWITKERKVVGSYPAFGGYESIRLFTYSNIDRLSDGETFALNQWVENASNYTGWSKETIQDLGMAISILGSLTKNGKNLKTKPMLLLPKPGNISIPSGGVGASAPFSINRSQFGKKIGKHAEDYNLNPSSAADRQHLFDKIIDIGTYPDKVVAGTFKGQGANGVREDVFFRIKGNDVVITEKMEHLLLL